MRRIPTLLGLTLSAFLPGQALATTEPPSTSAADASGADFVLQITYEGGFVPQEVAFVNAPALLITDDGRLIVQGPIPMIYPGPLLPNLLQRPISDAGVQAYLDLAEQAGLFEDREYEGNDMIADAPFTVVTIRVGDEEFVHSAYALGLEDESDPDRAALADFVADALDPVAVAGEGELGPEAPFESDSYLIQAYEVDEEQVGADELEPTFVEWPSETGVRLGDASACVEVAADAVNEVFADATQLTYFQDGGETYRVAAIPQLPGRGC
jgi:hypothetical protein